MKLAIHAPPSLRAQLTLWHGLVLGLVLVVFTLAVYGLLVRSLNTELDGSLVDRARQVNRSVERIPPTARDRRVVVPRADRFASADTFVQLSTVEGDAIGTSDNLTDTRLPLTAEDVAAVKAGRQRFSEAQIQGERVRVYAAPLVVRGVQTGIIQVARSLEPMARSLEWLRLLAGTGLLVATALSAVVVWLTTTRALRSLENVVATAAAIGMSGDLTHRVAQSQSTDEVGRLAATFNRMLGRLESSDAARRAAYAQVEQTLEAQRRFVADASHELRTPLTTIRGNASLLRQFSDVTLEDREAALAQIAHEAERMSRLVQDLLTLARADAGQRIAHERVELAPLLADVAAQARVLSRGQHIVVGCLEPIEVEGDPDALRQLLLILIDNALKYTPADGVINLSLEIAPTEARLIVADNGVGIAQEDLQHIFERFFRADSARRAGGAGLGLSIARWIAEEHGGRIEVNSSSEQGSTFTVCLPLAPGVVDRGEAMPASKHSYRALTST